MRTTGILESQSYSNHCDNFEYSRKRKEILVHVIVYCYCLPVLFLEVNIYQLVPFSWGRLGSFMSLYFGVDFL